WEVVDVFGNHGLGGLLEEGVHEKSPKCLGRNLGDFGEFCKGLGLFSQQTAWEARGRCVNTQEGCARGCRALHRVSCRVGFSPLIPPVLPTPPFPQRPPGAAKLMLSESGANGVNGRLKPALRPSMRHFVPSGKFKQPVILNTKYAVIPAQAGIQTCPHGNLNENYWSLMIFFIHIQIVKA
ncbi:hypothetical protein, partial [Neisseria basseii]|uniref:hypothetical protein n=1 Tax=Neisseria basseii TaxID=2830650 RepID=UPI00265A241B